MKLIMKTYRKHNWGMIISAIMAIIILSSCSPDKFILNQNERYPISGLIMSGLDRVDVIGENVLILNEEGRTALRSVGLTQFRADFTVELLKGDGIRLSIRSASHHYRYHPSLALDYTSNGCSITENGRLVKKIDSIRAIYRTPTRIIMENDGKYCQISVDCNIIYKGPTPLLATEYIILESINDTKARITGISFNDILEADPLLKTAEEAIFQPVYMKK